LLSRYETWKRIGDRRGKLVTELENAPRLTEENAWLWELYIDAASGVERLTYADLHAYQQITGVELTPMEARLLLTIDKNKKL